MTKIYETESRGYSWCNNKKFFLVTKEEYAEMVEKYKDHKNTYFREYYGTTYEFPCSTQVWLDSSITCHPETCVSDGFAVRGGRKFKAKGITIKHPQGSSSFDSSYYEYYFTEDSIEQNEQTKTESWWA